MDNILNSMRMGELSLNLVGDDRSQLVADYSKLASATRSQSEFSKPIHRLKSFIDSIRTRNVLVGLGQRYSKLSIPYLTGDSPYYGEAKSGDPTVLLGLSRISDSDHCKLFTDSDNILHWRSNMTERFPDSPLLQYDEIWRVFCHEIAVNIVEHSNSNGFLASRIVEPYYPDRKRLRHWCKGTYSEPVNKIFPYLKDGFVELCAADFGLGLSNTLADTYRERTGRTDEPTDEDVLVFAFDEFGTSKSQQESWCTKRHALGRVLNIVAKYGGAITVRSGKSEIIFATTGGQFKRRSSRLGFEPTSVQKLRTSIPGTHIQIIVPLNPNSSFESKDRESVLSKSLPSTFRIDPGHAQGHLIPIKEALDLDEKLVGAKSVHQLDKACEKLVRKLRVNNPDESLVFDFSNVDWTELEFETFANRMDNLFSNRLVLFVEIDVDLAKRIKRLEKEEEDSYLDNGEGTIKPRVHQPILGCDRDGKKYLFGVMDTDLEDAILSLMDVPRTKSELQNTFRLEPSIVETVLDGSNPLFQTESQKWKFAWSLNELQIELTRAMTSHFDKVIKRCQAWRGSLNSDDSGFSTIRDTGNEIFNLSWQSQDEWVNEFFESARLLSRGRLVDEVAQRLVFRLGKWLKLKGKSFEEISVLACINAPALLLANALRKWWPTNPKPAIADLGYYVMHNQQTIPQLSAGDGGYLIVQDLFHTGIVSNRLVRLLRAQGKNVVCKMAMAKMVEGQTESELAAISEWEISKLSNNVNSSTVNSDELDSIEAHAMFKIKKPLRIERPVGEAHRKYAHWVEPRTLRPIPLRQLRQERETDKRETFFSSFFENCILAAGHYVYGAQHYTIAIDVERALSGQLGKQIVPWIADICCGIDRNEDKFHWETSRGRELAGDVSAVLMPLHSQIHYLWPRVEELLWARGRRQHHWMLDATLFLGWGPSYRIPLQLEHQIENAVLAAIAHENSGKDPNDFEKGISILILDDATISGRTLETIVFAISKSVKDAYKRLGGPKNRSVSPIRWIRYFSIFNQLSHAKHEIWKNMRHVSTNPSIDFLFESYEHFFGIPVYSSDSCPSCKKIEQLKRSSSLAKTLNLSSSLAWLHTQMEELQPKSIDSPNFQRPDHRDLADPIAVLNPAASPSSNNRFAMKCVDSAIWRFYSLMYLSYPPADLLRELNVGQAERSDDAKEHRRYRWSVYEWCIRNWSRMIATSSRDAFANCIWQELQADTPLVEKTFEAMSSVFYDKYIQFLIGLAIQMLVEANLELANEELDHVGNLEFRQTKLYDAIALYLLRIDEVELLEVSAFQHPNSRSVNEDGKTLSIKFDEVRIRRLLDLLDSSANTAGQSSLNYLRNLHLTFTQPRRFARPEWSLRVVCENLFRGRDETVRGSSHRLLVKLLNDLTLDPSDVQTRKFLGSCLSLFVSALKDLERHVSDSAGLAIIEYCGSVIDWLRIGPSQPKFRRIPETVTLLKEALQEKNEFTNKFNERFHLNILEFTALLEDSENKQDTKDQLDFDCVIDPALTSYRILTDIHRLFIFIENWAIKPFQHYGQDGGAPSKSRIVVEPGDGSYLRFRLLTNFATLDETREQTRDGRNYQVAQRVLEPFGVEFADDWNMPDETETKAGFTSCFLFQVPTGFRPER